MCLESVSGICINIIAKVNSAPSPRPCMFYLYVMQVVQAMEEPVIWSGVKRSGTTDQSPKINPLLHQTSS
jgi:hypothetical protein